MISFVDDLAVISKDFDAHIAHLEKLFDRLLKHNLKLNFKKSNFAQEEISFLGHILSNKGLRPDPEKITTIKNFERPKNLKQLQAFLGFVNFYTKFAKSYSMYLLPLGSLLKKNVPFVWQDSHQEAFEKIKNLFDENIILKIPNTKKPYILTADASDYAIAGILSQLDENDEEVVITFISRILKGSELNYNTTQKEMLAIVWSVDRLNSYLRGAIKIIVRSDHEALSFLKSCKFGNSRLRRWNLALQEYNIEPEYLPGKKNSVADYLSRYMYPVDNSPNDIIIATALTDKPSKDMIKALKNLKTLQSNDAYIKSTKSDKRYKENAQGFICKIHDRVEKVVLPKVVINDLVWETHTRYGHIGSQKVLRILNESFYYPKLKPLVYSLFKTCDTCQKTKYLTIKYEEEKQPILTDGPCEILAVDFYGPLPRSKGGVQYIFTTIDVFSKFVVLYPMRKATTYMALKRIIGHYINNYGKPLKILSDHGTQFTSKKWVETLRRENIKTIYSSIRHPQSNPDERIHRVGSFL